MMMFLEEFSSPYFNKKNLFYHPETENVLGILGQVKQDTDRRDSYVCGRPLLLSTA